MKKNLIPTFLESIANKSFFILIFLYQLFFIFQGIDFSDEGFYGAFYQQIFRAPQSVEYNFMYWLSGIIGGAYLSLFHQFGLLALRFGGVLMITATMMVVYNGLKKYANPVYLKLGLFLATVVISFDPKDLNYDNLSSLFFVTASLLLFQGLKKAQYSRLYLSGILIALNTFTRLPNILGLSLCAIILYHGILHKTKFVYQLKQGLIFLGGFASATIVILLIMNWMGHYSIFVDCLKLVSEMGRSTENTHGIKRMLILFRYEYSFTLLRGIVFLLFLLAMMALLKKLEGSPRMVSTLKLLGCMATIVCLYVAFQEKMISWYLLLSLVTGLSIMAAVFIIIDKTKDQDQKVLSLLGIMMVIVQPLGSDFGLYSMGRYSLWLALPIAMNYFFSLENISKSTILNSYAGNYLSAPMGSLRLTKPSLALVRNWTVFSLVLLFLYYAFIGTWFDSRNRLEMRYTVNNSYLKGVFTTKEKAEDINELLQESTKYVKKDDYVLAYDLIPLYYPMTETRPFVRNSWPKLYDRQVFKMEMEKAVSERKLLPVIIYQKVNTLGNRNWPDLNNKDWDLNQPRNAYIKSFMETNHYKMVWENNAFRILIPG